MLNFPDAPTIGQSFPPYKWDGVKWALATPVDPSFYADPPDDTNPLVNGVNIPGLVTKYSRADHAHPTDTSRAPTNDASLTGTSSVPAANITGNINITGIFTGTSKGHYLGTASGSWTTPSPADANILLYDAGGGNWAGMGSDGDGVFWMRTGLSGSPRPAFTIDPSRNFTFLKTPQAPTPATADNSTRIATTAFVLANPASGPYIPVNGGCTVTGLLYVAGDWRTYRSDGSGVVFLNNTGDRYVHWSGNNYWLPGAHANSANGRLWGNGDFATPIVNIRLAHIGDYNIAPGVGLTEPYGGSCTTGNDGAFNGITWRFRQFQIQLGNAGWYAVGYA
jgi:hypothetical protein